jgi:hypothetical protein
VNGVQRERIMQGGSIKRVYVFDYSSDYDDFKDVMIRQEMIGVNVKWILKEDLLRSPLVAESVKELGTLDIAVADGSWVFRVFVDDAGMITSSNAIKDEECTRLAKVLFYEGYNKGNPV